MKIIAFLMLFLLLGAFFIVSNENLRLIKKDEFMQFGRIYYSWLFSLADNFKGMTGFVVNQNWLPKLNESS